MDIIARSHHTNCACVLYSHILSICKCELSAALWSHHSAGKLTKAVPWNMVKRHGSWTKDSLWLGMILHEHYEFCYTLQPISTSRAFSFVFLSPQRIVSANLEDWCSTNEATQEIRNDDWRLTSSTLLSIESWRLRGATTGLSWENLSKTSAWLPKAKLNSPTDQCK